MTRDEVRAFLTSDPPRPGVLATTRRDGRPHAAPLWYVVDDDGTIVFTTGADTVKGRTLQRRGWATMTVDDDRPPFSFVTVEGPVTISDDLDAVQGWAARIAGRYMGADLADELGPFGRILIGIPERHLMTAGSLRPGDEAFAELFADFVLEQSGGSDEPIDRRAFELVGGRLVEFAGLGAVGG